MSSRQEGERSMPSRRAWVAICAKREGSGMAVGGLRTGVVEKKRAQERVRREPASWRACWWLAP